MRQGDSVYHKKNGRWEARYPYGYDENGKTIYKSVYGATREEALQLRKQRLEILSTRCGGQGIYEKQHLNLIILGAGSHGKNVYELAKQIGIFEDIRFLDDDISIQDGELIVGSCKKAADLRVKYPCAFVAIGDGKKRKKWTEQLDKWGYMFPKLISPAAHISSSAVIGEGTCVMAEATINAAIIGRGCIVSSMSLVDVDANIADYVHVGSGVIVEKQAKVSECIWLRTGMIIR